MVNYLSLLGWNDGTEDEIFSVQDLGKERLHMGASLLSVSIVRNTFGSARYAITSLVRKVAKLPKTRNKQPDTQFSVGCDRRWIQGCRNEPAMKDP